MRLHVLVTSAVLLACAATTFAGAQTPLPAPSPIVVPTLPPDSPNADFIRAAIGLGRELLEQQRQRLANNAYGTVTYFRRYDMQVRTGINAYRAIHLHPGTVINPRGATPAAGSKVSISGTGQPDGSLEANAITIQQ
jgi:hypothetical protein